MFTTQQQFVLDLISEGQNIGHAAVVVGIHRNTISNWRRNSVAYRYAWDLAHYDQVITARDRAVGLAYDAISTLNNIMGNHHHPPGARIRAAIAILQRAETVPPAATQPPPGYAPELPIPQCYSPEDHAPDKIEFLAQSAQLAVAPGSPASPITTDAAVTYTPVAPQLQTPPLCTTEPTAQAVAQPAPLRPDPPNPLIPPQIH